MNNSTVKNSRAVGIDLGTTCTVMAYCDDTGKPKAVPNLEGDLKTPSCVPVGRRGREVLVGTAAWSMQVMEPERTFIEFKREVGTDRLYLTEGALSVSPEWCQTEVLKFMRQSALKYFGDDRAASQAAITVPAYFGEKERQSVKRSAEQAGIEVLGLINEPTAAALAYGINEKQGDRVVFTPDFGGGTFDASLIAFQGGVATVLASHGDKHLGGKDVDEALMQLVVQAFAAEHGLRFDPKSHPADGFATREDVIRQKHLLCTRTEIKLCARVDGKQVAVPVTRERLASLLKPLLERIEKITLDTIANAKVQRPDIKHVLLVGGSSRLAPFQELLKRLFGSNCFVGGQVSPDLAVAEGAVIHAAKLFSASGKTLVSESLKAIPAPSIKHTDVMPHSLGVAVQDPVTQALFCSVILEKNQPLPCTALKTYAAVEDRQTQFHVQVLQGEDGQRLEDTLVVGERQLHLPAGSSAEPSLDVTMGYNASGMVTVEVKDRVSGRKEDITINHYAAKPLKDGRHNHGVFDEHTTAPLELDPQALGDSPGAASLGESPPRASGYHRARRRRGRSGHGCRRQHEPLGLPADAPRRRQAGRSPLPGPARRNRPRGDGGHRVVQRQCHGRQPAPAGETASGAVAASTARADDLRWHQHRGRTAAGPPASRARGSGLSPPTAAPDRRPFESGQPPGRGGGGA